MEHGLPLLELMVSLDADWFVRGRDFPYLNFRYNLVALSSHKAALCDY